ncbi:hypothetical protein CAEBREN_15980 [Caenorhabditis brenneri]|uniref:Uncharacterized protein n=1 Tax=Caenorhabditis brenneri TaxID=135651 RepID=G0NWC3_CAEBE|nr:hypothetical protein CAEBREN_15980 [Caenorhabditis brenneri]
MLHPTLLLPVLIGCSLATFIAPQYVPSYGYGFRTAGGGHRSGTGTNPSDSGDGSGNQPLDTAGGKDPSPVAPGRYVVPAITRPGPNGKVIFTNCAVCRLCCIGRNVSYTVVQVPPGANPGPYSYPIAPGAYPVPPNPLPPNPAPPGSTFPPGPLPPGPEPPVTEGPPIFPVPTGEPVTPGPGEPLTEGPYTPEVITPGPGNPEDQFYPVAPGQYATAPPTFTQPPLPPCVPLTTAPPTTNPPTYPPCQYTPNPSVPPTQPPVTYPPTEGPITPQPTVFDGYPTLLPDTTPSGYVTWGQYETPQAPPTTTTTEAPEDVYIIPERPTPSWPIFPVTEGPVPTPRVPEGPGNNNECCYIDLRSIQATVSCGAIGGSRTGCCSQSCSSSSTVQRQISINFQLLARYFGQIPSKITCTDAVRFGLVHQSEITGVCAPGYYPLPTEPAVPPTAYPPVTPGPEITIPTNGPDAYVVPKSGISSFSAIASILTIILSTVLCL